MQLGILRWEIILNYLAESDNNKSPYKREVRELDSEKRREEKSAT